MRKALKTSLKLIINKKDKKFNKNIIIFMIYLEKKVCKWQIMILSI